MVSLLHTDLFCAFSLYSARLLIVAVGIMFTIVGVIDITDEAMVVAIAPH